MKVCTAAILALVTSASSARPITLQNHNFVDLNVGAKEIVLNIGYPGMGGKSCGVELRASNQYGSEDGLSALANALEIREGFRDPAIIEVSQPTPGGPATLQYEFPRSSLHTYMTLVHVKTKDGSSLADMIRRTVKPGVHDDPKPRVIVVLTDCR